MPAQAQGVAATNTERNFEHENARTGDHISEHLLGSPVILLLLRLGLVLGCLREDGTVQQVNVFQQLRLGKIPVQLCEGEAKRLKLRC